MTTYRHDTDEFNGSKETPKWDLESEYPSVSSDLFASDLESVRKDVAAIKKVSDSLSVFAEKSDHLTDDDIKDIVPIAHSIAKEKKNCELLLWNLSGYVMATLCTEPHNEEARARQGELRTLESEFTELLKPLQVLLIKGPEKLIESYLTHPLYEHEAFDIRMTRTQKIHALSVGEEKLLSTLKKSGLRAWSDLYNELSTTLQAEVNLPSGTQKVGVAKLRVLAQTEDAAVRKECYTAGQKAWESIEDTMAFALNSIAGFRADEYRTRSHSRPLHFLDTPLLQNRIQKQTLDAMFESVKAHREVAYRALRTKAKTFGQKNLNPWDLGAPAPIPKSVTEKPKKLNFKEGVDLITKAFSEVSPDLSSFFQQIIKNNWVEGRTLDEKRPGGFCMKFPKSKTPRIFMTYGGDLGSISTLAHEAGHAFHSWMMRDLPLDLMSYPMTLAETASIFAETVLKDHYVKTAKGSLDRYLAAWEDATSAYAFILLVPQRFDFEKAVYEKIQSRGLSASEFKKLYTDTEKEVYGDTLTEVPEMGWASTLHYYISGLSFYNFPYTFGYLFSLGVYAQKDKLGDSFFQKYIDLLRDTGRMTAEELAEKHLGVDLTQHAFWEDALGMVSKQITHFESLVDELF